MAKPKEQPTYEEALEYLRGHEFDVLEAPGVANRVFVKKYGCSAAIEKASDGHVKLFAKPGYLLGGEIARLIDKGYQKFFKTSKLEVPATADQLKSLHQFTEELRVATGVGDLYNEALGTVSDRYVYDRVVDRDEPETARPKRPWEKAGAEKPAQAKTAGKKAK